MPKSHATTSLDSKPGANSLRCQELLQLSGGLQKYLESAL